MTTQHRSHTSNFVMPAALAGRAALLSLLLGISGAGHAGSTTGTDYTNFGNDLRVPIFPGKNWLQIFKNKDDTKPATEINGAPVLDVADGNWKACISKEAPAERVRCNIRGTDGWVDRHGFVGPQEVAPYDKWPFRYWLHVASDGIGGEETDMLYKAVPHSPYLIKPRQFASVFFIVQFDRRGFAISPKTGKKTGDRIFMAGHAAYLAPDDPKKRLRKRWLFLAYYHADLKALCPGAARESCTSAVNLQPQWSGIKALHTEPAPARHAPGAGKEAAAAPMFGAGEVAFGRHGDAVVPFNYLVPSTTYMDIDGNATTDAEHAAHRAKPFCLIDCTPGSNPIAPDPTPWAF